MCHMLLVGWGSNKKIPSVGKVWIFYGTTHTINIARVFKKINDTHIFLIEYAGKSKAKFISKKSVVT